MRRGGGSFKPFGSRGRGRTAAALSIFALLFSLSVVLSIRATSRSRHSAAQLEVAGRQRTLAERYLADVLLVRAGGKADPAQTGSWLSDSADALLMGGTAPAVNGDDDDTSLSPMADPVIKRQLEREQSVIADLTATGNAVLADRPALAVPLTAGEQIQRTTGVERLRVLTNLAANVSLNTAREIAARSDNNVNNLITLQIGVGIGGLLISLLLGWALVASTRRQTAHYRSLVTSSTDLVFVLGDRGCRYASRSLAAMLGRSEVELLGSGLAEFVHEDDRERVERAWRDGEPRELVFRLVGANGEARNVEAHLTDLRDDRHIRGVVFNARDITERIRLEEELTRQAERDGFGSQVSEALEMADEEDAAYDVLQRAMVEISEATPMELLLADSSHAHLDRAAQSPTAGAPGCPVESPYSCVAVRRGSPVVFESSESLNACPKLRDRPGGPCSAVCVPVSFMGRALGVVHATGPENKPLGAEQVSQLTTLATQGGARIGTVRAFEKTQLQAATDGLTGLINRRTLEGELRRMARAGRTYSLAFADLDNFKALNDKYGHQAGDRALRLFAQITEGSLREGAMLARWGGEEFAILLPDVDREVAAGILDRVRERLAEAHTGDHPRFTASFGVTDSTVADSPDQLVRIADAALYESKRLGRDRVTVGDTAIDLDRVVKPAERTNGRSHKRPLLHQAADEEYPDPSGAEIR